MAHAPHEDGEPGPIGGDHDRGFFDGWFPYRNADDPNPFVMCLAFQQPCSLGYAPVDGEGEPLLRDAGGEHDDALGGGVAVYDNRARARDIRSTAKAEGAFGILVPTLSAIGFGVVAEVLKSQKLLQHTWMGQGISMQPAAVAAFSGSIALASGPLVFAFIGNKVGDKLIGRRILSGHIAGATIGTVASALVSTVLLIPWPQHKVCKTPEQAAGYNSTITLANGSTLALTESLCVFVHDGHNFTVSGFNVTGLNRPNATLVGPSFVNMTQNGDQFEFSFAPLNVTEGGQACAAITYAAAAPGTPAAQAIIPPLSDATLEIVVPDPKNHTLTTTQTMEIQLEGQLPECATKYPDRGVVAWQNTYGTQAPVPSSVPQGARAVVLGPVITSGPNNTLTLSNPAVEASIYNHMFTRMRIVNLDDTSSIWIKPLVSYNVLGADASAAQNFAAQVEAIANTTGISRIVLDVEANWGASGSSNNEGVNGTAVSNVLQALQDKGIAVTVVLPPNGDSPEVLAAYRAADVDTVQITYNFNAVGTPAHDVSSKNATETAYKAYSAALKRPPSGLAMTVAQEVVQTNSNSSSPNNPFPAGTNVTFIPASQFGGNGGFFTDRCVTLQECGNGTLNANFDCADSQNQDILAQTVCVDRSNQLVSEGHSPQSAYAAGITADKANADLYISQLEFADDLNNPNGIFQSAVRGYNGGPRNPTPAPTATPAPTPLHTPTQNATHSTARRLMARDDVGSSIPRPFGVSDAVWATAQAAGTTLVVTFATDILRDLLAVRMAKDEAIKQVIDSATAAVTKQLTLTADNAVEVSENIRNAIEKIVRDILDGKSPKQDDSTLVLEIEGAGKVGLKVNELVEAVEAIHNNSAAQTARIATTLSLLMLQFLTTALSSGQVNAQLRLTSALFVLGINVALSVWDRLPSAANGVIAGTLPMLAKAAFEWFLGDESWMSSLGQTFFALCATTVVGMGASYAYQSAAQAMGTRGVGFHTRNTPAPGARVRPSIEEVVDDEKATPVVSIPSARK